MLVRFYACNVNVMEICHCTMLRGFSPFNVKTVEANLNITGHHHQHHQIYLQYHTYMYIIVHSKINYRCSFYITKS